MNFALRWGILSTANIARVAVIPAIRASRNGELAAVASRGEERAREFAGREGIARHHGSYDALIADADVDAVYIGLPNSLHREWTIRAAEAGKHVLCEKPLALDEAECRDMEAAAAGHGVLLMEAFMYRFHPRTERLVELACSGVIGDVRLVHSAFTFRLTRPDNIRLNAELGGGALMDVGCYCVNVSRTIAGAEPTEVQATMRRAPSGVDEQLVGMLDFGGAIYAQFDCALSLERREFVEVAGTGGRLEVQRAFLPGTGAVEIVEQHGTGDELRHGIEGVDQYRLMVEHFAECALEGRAPRYLAAEAALNMRTIEALYRSARNGGRPQTL